MTTALPDKVRKLLDGPTFVVVTTVNADGSPQSTVVWVKRDGDDILFSTVRGRKKTRNMERDPRISICAYDPEQPYSYFTVDGSVALVEEGGKELINELSLKYDGQPYTFDPPEAVRVVCRLTPRKVISQ
ncbi:PPOX class F420-dependent oxidoreductase [Actinoplanes friuliensis]|jgi:PPOX class probable F420-dependent enzyme|uniref:Putative pyridoxamine 5'-phosphate oxidase-related protein n=1 Tax=Actinoplanes friuliensis DSM 7358 TaxID=1246995 RepID=U5WBY8_9ACTN|nr:PPOX class F420-dependent oxidoreductase [Actinoplanes friuliensis]AGZ46507.1 putative pyridoxamine 5'-phosphate oxidase-related protein [Actinoplanes friuliensis DSM 7358]